MNNNETSHSIDSPKESHPPDLSICSFELWIFGRQFPDADDYWDGNWLDVTAKCCGTSSIVHAHGSILHLSELQQWLVECKQVYTTLSGEAHLRCMEPNIDVKIQMKERGACELLVSLTNDHLYEQHSFCFEIDQSYLPKLIENLETVLYSYPLKGETP